jgi:zinc transport system substrate-binding protein
MSVSFNSSYTKIAVRIIILITLFIPLNSHASPKLKVAASFYPLAHFAEMAGGQNVDVTNIMPPGSEPHEFEPTPGDMRKIYRSEIFLFNGLGLDPWAERLEPDLSRQGTTIIKMSRFFSSGTQTVQESGKHDNDNRHGDFDPHIWLDPLLAAKEVEIIRDVLISIDPDHENAYMVNSSAYIKLLYKLHQDYEKGLTSCRMRDIIVAHDAFSHLGRRYNLTVHSITGISPEEEPSPRKMVALAKLAMKLKINHIFFEQLTSSKLAETIAGEVEAETLVLNPLGGLTPKDISRGRTYISVMEDNLKNLRIAMECK